MDTATRIAQFEKMAREDPENDMAHFSLGGAYAQAGRHADAAAAYLKCVEANPAMSKAWQLAGASLMASGDSKRAAATLTRGFVEAASRGDRMPQQAMAGMLKELGEPIPEIKGAAAAAAGVTGDFVCKRTGKPGSQLEDPPMRGPLGRWIQENISAETWRAWIGQGTKVINELRLDFSRDQDQAVYEKHMCEYLGIDDDLYARLTGQQTA